MKDMAFERGLFLDHFVDRVLGIEHNLLESIFSFGQFSGKCCQGIL
jgi:hypothetical protein